MEPQSMRPGARVELDRCQGCGRFIGPHDAVCGHCGRPCAAFIRSRAARFGITAQDCPHCLAGSGQPWVCVRCGAPLPVTGAVSKGTRLGLVCIRCGAALRGDAYCTCCGAPVRSRSISPSKRDKTLLAFAQFPGAERPQLRFQDQEHQESASPVGPLGDNRRPCIGHRDALCDPQRGCRASRAGGDPGGSAG